MGVISEHDSKAPLNRCLLSISTHACKPLAYVCWLGLKAIQQKPPFVRGRIDGTLSFSLLRIPKHQLRAHVINP